MCNANPCRVICHFQDDDKRIKIAKIRGPQLYPSQNGGQLNLINCLTMAVLAYSPVNSTIVFILPCPFKKVSLKKGLR